MLAQESDLVVAGEAEWVIGGDTHRDWHDLAITRATTGEIVCQLRIDATLRGYLTAAEWARDHAAGRRLWAIEGTGSYGAGLTRFLAGQGEQVVEAPRPARADRRRPKTDQLDAIRAARSVLAGGRQATPRAAGKREALRLLVSTRQGAVNSHTMAINELRAAITVCPDPLRNELRHLPRGELVKRCARIRHRTDIEPGTILALNTLAKRIQQLQTEHDQLKTVIHQHVETLAPQLLQQHGIGPITAAHVYIAWSHKGRIRSEAAFANLAGTAPIPASSGNTTRHRINHAGDRKLNSALHMIITTRARTDDATKAYITRRTQQGLSTKDAKRCLKRYLARSLYRLLENTTTPT